MASESSEHDILGLVHKDAIKPPFAPTSGSRLEKDIPIYQPDETLFRRIHPYQPDEALFRRIHHYKPDEALFRRIHPYQPDEALFRSRQH